MILALWVGALACGIGAALLAPAAGVVAVAAAVLAGLWCLARRRRVTALVAAAVVVGAVLGHRALGLAGGVAGDPGGLVDADGPGTPPADPLWVLARVIRGPEPAGPEGGKARLYLDCQALGGRPAGGATLALSILTGAPDVAPGDTVTFRARVSRPTGFANPGLVDPALLARAHGIDLVAALPSAEAIRRTATGFPLNPRRVAFRLRRAMGRALEAGAGPEVAGLLAGVVLGQRSAIGDDTEEGFRAAGATHVLSVSGLHLAAVAASLFFLLRWLASLWPRLALRVSPATLAAALSIPAIAFYTLLTGEAVATVRSALMAGVAFAAIIVRRPFSLAAGIAMAGGVLLVDSPLLMLDVSFQLSFASVVALGMFGHVGAGAGSGTDGNKTGTRVRAALRWLARPLAVSTAAAGMTAPLVAHHFGEITPLAPVGNLILVPLVELGVVPLGLAGALLGAASPVLGALPLAVARQGARAALAVAGIFRNVAPVLHVRSPDTLETMALTAAGALLLVAIGRMGRGSARPWLLGAMAAAAVAAVSLGARDWARRTSSDLAVTFLDVGQGDAAVVEGPGGFTALVDGGGMYDESFDPGERIVEPYLRTRGIGRLDLVVLSHPHPDHLNGLRRVLARFDVGALWTSGDDARNPIYGQLVQLARARRIPMPGPAAWASGALAVEPLAPWLGDRIGAPPGVGVNDASLVVRFRVGTHAFLFAGDLEADGEAELVGRGAAGLRIAAEVLKVPHHGSRTSSTADLLDAVAPEVAVISLGLGNRFRFPAGEVLARYRERGIRVLRTDRDGAIRMTVSATGERDATCVRGCR